MNSQLILAASLDNLIILVVIAVLSGLHSWWKKKHGEPEAEEEDNDSPLPPRPRAPRPGSVPPPQHPPASNWEEELRRLLQGEKPAPTPPPMAPPPFVMAPPPPLPPAPRPVIRQSAAPKPHLAHSNIPIPLEGDEEEVGLPVKMPSLEHSAQAFLRRSSVESMVTERLLQAGKQVADHTASQLQLRGTSPEAQRALALLRERTTLRSAIIASIILGPPKALAD